MRRQLHVLGAAVLAACLAMVPVSGTATAGQAPRTVVTDGKKLADIQSALRHGHATRAQRDALKVVLDKANTALSAGPWSVMDKPTAPPSGDKHDYMSQAPYWWAGEKTPENPQGCPYVNKDGQRNPEADAITDHTYRMVAWDAMYYLSLAWYYTGDPKYAKRAALDIRTWFLDPATRMNPNMTYSQIIPCKTTISGTGIIDSTQSFSQVLDVFALLDTGAPGWTNKDRTGVKAWLSQYLTWMQTSPQAKLELAATNNHGTFLDMQNATIAAYLGRRDTAKKIVLDAEKNRFPVQFAADGSQPLELSRTMSWHYVNFNLTAWGRMAELGKNLGVDVWKYTAPNGATLRKVVDQLIPGALQGAAGWPHQQIGVFDQSIAADIFHAAAEEAHDQDAAAALKKMPLPAGGDTWSVRVSCFPLDPPLK
ncbi:alginate lyase family protein [Amycolatopsis sp., V23-08]|uniref:Alginate lyase family protein n=1 Tax=Amycolatopsis heterodermiae TaxID=3110235 RepID=A0ABU5R1F5_9PSEU|nr:alginate lyase family protein [Amycolatopsis sp., V23-08]MEA5360026.1 alginate lyase family protein [Amycolatopsis sp., V23-08]